MRDFLVMAVFYGSLPFIPFRPFYGLLVFSWLAYMRPQNLAWTLGDERFSFYVGILTIVGLGLAVLRGREKFMTVQTQTILLILMAIWMAITAENAMNVDKAWRWANLFIKIIAVSLITTGLVRDRRRFRILLIVIAFSLGLLGVKYGLFGAMRGGVRFNTGPGGFMGDNNTFALALNMAIPLLAGIAWVEKEKYLRFAAIGMIMFTYLAIFFTFSRGGLVTLAVVSALLLVYSKRPVLAAAVLALGITVFVSVSSDRVLESYRYRASTISRYEQDSSAMNRLRAWEVSWWVFNDNPIFGVGPQNFVDAYRQYGNPDEKTRVAHNSFFQLLAEGGIPAVSLFLALVFVTLFRLQLVAFRYRSDWVTIYSRMIQISIIGYFAGGMLLDMAYFDLFYHLVAMSVCLEVAAAAERTARKPASVEPKREVPWWKESPAMRPGTA